MKNARVWCVTCAAFGAGHGAYLVASSRAQRCGVQRESAGRREPPPACERLPPGPPRAPRPRHARATHRLHRHTRPRHRTPPPRAELPTLVGARCGLTHHAIIDVFCEMCRADRGARHAPAELRPGGCGRGGDPARCVTHLSRRFLACSRSPPSAETCRPGSLRALGRAPPSHCDGVNALRETLRITSVKLNRAELSDICYSMLARSYFYLYGKMSAAFSETLHVAFSKNCGQFSVVSRWCFIN